MDNFKNPGSIYRGLPFWSWNCAITKELIDEQLPIFKEMGFGGVVIHPREGLDTEYLGDEFMRLVKHTIDRCCELDLVCWLYDDDRFPSGAADGLVTKNPRYRARQLRLTKARLTDGYCASRAEFEAELDAGRIPRGYFLAAYEVTLTDKRLANYRRLSGICAPADNIRFAYLELQEESPWFQGQTYVDTMNPDAVDEFIHVTHERYKAALGSELGNCAEAIFTDEPRLGKQGPPKSSISGEDVFLPYNEYFAARFAEKYGFDPLDIIPEYVWDNADGDVHNRLIYRDMTAECFTSVFMDRISEWCRKNNVIMTGHVLGEETLTSQTCTLGEAMRVYRNMDIPGIDILIDGREFNTAKQAASVAAQNGIKDVMSEEYGVTNWDATFRTFKLQGDWQAALGITKRIPHLSHMSLEGEGKRDWPGSIFYHAPWYKELRSLETYFARLNAALTSGKRQTRVAVVHPVESMWALSSPDDVSLTQRKRLDEGFASLAEWLLLGTIDFDYVSESLIPEQDVKCDNNKLSVGHSSYDAVIVPELVTIRSTTLEMLEKFAASGGAVIFAGDLPRLIGGSHSDRAARLAEKCIVVPFKRSDILNALEPYRDVKLTADDNKPASDLIYQLRDNENEKWLFIAHAYGKGAEKQNLTITIDGKHYAELYDAMTGERFSLPATHTDGKTQVALPCHRDDSLLLRLSDAPSVLPEYAPALETTPVMTLDTPQSFRLHEPNVLLLDFARFSIDGSELQPGDEILRAENNIRKQLGFFERTGMDLQPYATEEGEMHTVTLHYEFFSDIETSAQLAIENPHIRKIRLNGVEADNTATGYFVDKSIKTIDVPDIKPGKNELVIETRYNQKTFLENIYLLGDFSVTDNRVITAPIKALDLGNITKKGLPYYTGSIDYVFDAELECDGKYSICVPEFSAPALYVSVDGERKGIIAYAPHRASLGQLASGRHTITVTLYGNRFNSFGMLHNANENYTWYGNSSYRTDGSDWTYDYMLRPVGIMSDVLVERSK